MSEHLGGTMTTRRILTAIAVCATLLLTGCVEEPPPTDIDLALCQVEKSTVRTAAIAFHALHGRYPAIAQELVDANLLEEAPQHAWMFTVVDESLVLVGPC